MTEHEEKLYLEYAGVILSCKTCDQVRECRKLIRVVDARLGNGIAVKLIRVARTKKALLIAEMASINLKGKFMTEKLDWIWTQPLNPKIN